MDTYHAPSNTIYEYYGDYWHGNPTIFNPSDFNKKVVITFGELYNRSLGYKIVTKWETPFEDKLLK